MANVCGLSSRRSIELDGGVICLHESGLPSAERRVAASCDMRRKTALAVLCALGGLGATAAAQATTTVTHYTYDAGDHITTVTDPRGLITAYNVDGLGQLWGVSSPDTGTTTYTYDAYGQRTSMTRANGATTTYAYDALGRRTSLSAGGQTQTFAYDHCANGLGRLCSVSDATGSTVYTYSPEGWLVSRGFSISGTGYALGYAYDAMGHLTAITYPDGHQARYSYANGAVSGITFTVGGTQLTAASGVTWQPMNTALASWTASNGLSNTLSYDTDGRLTGISVPGVEALAYRYDAANRLTGITNALDGTLSQDFGYDEQSRLVAMTSANQDASYGYDADGNRITGATNAGTSNTSYSASSNQLVNTSGVSPQRYGYDAQGNLTTLNGATTYQYDAFNRLSAAAGTSYYVNPEGQRLRKSGGAGTTYFAPDASGTLLAEDDNGSWIDYVWLGGRLIGRAVNGQLEAIGDDQLGRPQVVTNAAQQVVWSAQNWPFDRSVTLSNTAPLNLGFPGQYFDAETGLWNNGFRDYDPALGRYMESDPLGLAAGVNTYAYVGGNPLINTDPLGLESPTVEPTAQQMSEMGAADAANINMRLPDVAQFEVGFGPFSSTATFTKYGDMFVGGNVNPILALIGTFSQPWLAGVSISDGWAQTSCAPSRTELNNIVAGKSSGVSFYDGFGGGYSTNASGTIVNIGVGYGGLAPSAGGAVQTGNVFGNQ